MAYPRIRLLIEGSSGDDKFIPITDFIKEIQLFSGALKEAEKEIISDTEKCNEYHIVELSYSSPATITVEARPKDLENDYSEKTIKYLFNIFGTIRKNEVLSQSIRYELLSEIRDMTNSIGKTLSKVTIARDDEFIEMDPIFADRIRELLRPEEIFPTAMRGMLEAINLHKGVNVFRLYPDIGPSKLTCHFPANLQDKAISAIGRFVEVSGNFKYKLTSPYPHEVFVTEIEIFPDDNLLPSFYDIKGTAPNATGELLSEDFIRGIRDASA